MATQTEIKQITFSKAMLLMAKIRAEEIGFTIPEYIRYLVARDTEHLQSPIPMVDEETEKAIGRSLEDLRKGRFTVLKTEAEIKNHFKKLEEQAKNGA